MFIEIIKDMLLIVLAVTAVFIGIVSIAYLLVHGAGIVSILVGFVGFYILSPAIQAWKDYIWYFFNKNKEN
jgi:hypothetical protein